MKTFAFILLLSMSPLFADSHPGLPPNPYETAGGKKSPAFSQASAQAIYWINLIDQFQWAATWGESSGLLKDVISRDQWAAAMKATRQSLGPVMSRTVGQHQFVSQLQYGTRGNFVIIKYNTNYSNMNGAVETITLMTEGQLAEWKVVAYSIGKR